MDEVVVDARCDERQVRATDAQNTSKFPQIPYTDKIFGVPVEMQHQVPTDPVR